jgi:hypothetical protein
LELLDGDALLHTDFNPLNILVGPDRVWIIDWAWPTRGRRSSTRPARATHSMRPRQRPVWRHDDSKPVVILGMGYLPWESAGDVDAAFPRSSGSFEPHP